MQGWAERLEAAAAFGEREELILLAVAFAEYLARIAGGIPMSQGETVRLATISASIPRAIERFWPSRCVAG